MPQSFRPSYEFADRPWRRQTDAPLHWGYEFAKGQRMMQADDA
jgi:hypothetical protein